jgi:hypothetical protein
LLTVFFSQDVDTESTISQLESRITEAHTEMQQLQHGISIGDAVDFHPNSDNSGHHASQGPRNSTSSLGTPGSLRARGSSSRTGSDRTIIVR